MQTQSVDRLVGQILGNCRVERLLGQGRLNAVYMAQDLSAQSSVALTLFIVPEHFSPDARQRFMQRFRKEAKALTALRHQHILPVYEYGEYQGNPYLVTPYMMNGSLADLLKREGRLPHERVLDILEQVVAGLEYAHSKGVIHGTLKPANIVLDAEQKMLVAGFGLMHVLQKRGIENTNQPYAHLFSIADTFLAAPEYLAPEIVQGQSIDRRSDIYALGIILFELLSGKPPFSGSKPLEIARLHVEQEVPSLRTLCSDVPVALTAIVNQALERDPARRFQRAGELAEAFAQASIGATSSLHPMGSARKERKETALPDSTQDTAAREAASGNWQFKPPIVTGTFSALKPPAKTPPAKESVSTAQSSEDMKASSDSWQLLPPIVTGQLPSFEAAKVSRETSEKLTAVKQPDQPAARARRDPVPAPPPSTKPVRQRASTPDRSAPPASAMSLDGLAGQDQSDDWWTQPSAPEPLAQRSQPPTGWNLDHATMERAYTEMPSTSRPSRTPKRARKTSRRSVIALLAAGGVAAAGTAVALNTNVLHMVNAALHSPSSTTIGTHPSTASMQQGNAKGQAAGMQQNASAAQGHTGSVIGSTKQPLNSATAFVNPANQKASLLVRSPQGTFTALERACTHVGVYVNYNPSTHTLICPAHGAIFNATTGAVLQGPATRPLPKVAIRVNGDGTITAS